MGLNTLIALLAALAVTLVLGIALAYLPMRLLVGQMARNIRQFIQRSRDRRNEARGTPDRRRV
ncbi:MAG TPA: hypothetical protein VNA69_16665 [Thermoanaerobaculia bacterium]|nr:hypothetical protein [Thermoanaerobaculia bacterium]